eukprot:s933_g7.t2
MVFILCTWLNSLSNDDVAGTPANSGRFPGGASKGGQRPQYVLTPQMTEMKQEERCQVVVCRNGQEPFQLMTWEIPDESSGLKIVLKPGDSFRLGRARENEVVLDYDAASKHHAEISLHQTLPEEVPAGSDSKLPTVLSIRDLSSKNGIGIRKTIEQDAVPTVASFEQLEAKTSQATDKPMEFGIAYFFGDKQILGVTTLGCGGCAAETWPCTALFSLASILLGLETQVKGSSMPNGPRHGSRIMGHGQSPGHHGGHFGGDHFSQAHDAAWEDEGLVCFEPTEKTNHSNWKWVGDGRGAYEKVDTFAFVGHGAGSFEKRTIDPNADGGSILWLCFRACWCGILAGLIFFLIVVFARHHLILPRSPAFGAYDPASECTQDLSMVPLWSPAKKAFCCAQTGRLGCAPATTAAPLRAEPPPPSCDGSVARWSKHKTDWCCRHKGVACSPPPSMPYNCHERPLEVWSLGKKLWCCENYQVGCPHYHVATLPFDCDAGVHSWHHGWSIAKKAFCCAEFHVGCVVTTPAPAPAAMPYDCHAGYSNWRTGWSEGKKSFCCQHFKRGCSSDPYDCDAGFSNWNLGGQRGWSDGKKKWCCDHGGHGCPAKDTWSYNCDVGVASRDALWSPGKKDWCCKHANRGCTKDTSEEPRFDCMSGFQHWSETWTESKSHGRKLDIAVPWVGNSHNRKDPGKTKTICLVVGGCSLLAEILVVELLVPSFQKNLSCYHLQKQRRKGRRQKVGGYGSKFQTKGSADFAQS